MEGHSKQTNSIAMSTLHAFTGRALARPRLLPSADLS